MRLSSPVPLIRANALGYTYRGEIVDGFRDCPELPLLARVRLARLAERYAPEALCDVQRRLLASTHAARDAERRPSAALDGFQANAIDDEVATESGIYAELSSKELRWVADPGSRPLLDICTRYPLTLLELHLLSGADERRLDDWTRQRLIPAHLTGDRRAYFSAGVARALRLAQADSLRLRSAP